MPHTHFWFGDVPSALDVPPGVAEFGNVTINYAKFPHTATLRQAHIARVNMEHETIMSYCIRNMPRTHSYDVLLLLLTTLPHPPNRNELKMAGDGAPLLHTPYLHPPRKWKHWTMNVQIYYTNNEHTYIVIIYVIKLLVFVDFCVRDAIHRCAPYFESIDINCFQLSDLVSLIMVRLTFDLARAERNVCALAVSRYQVIELGCFLCTCVCLAVARQFRSHLWLNADTGIYY